MTVARIGQLTAETRVITDISLTGPSTGSNAPVISSTQAKTGTYSYRVESATFPWGFAFAQAQTALRIGFWMFVVDGTLGDNVILYRAGYALGNDERDMHLHISLDSSTGLMRIRRPLTDNSYEILASVAIPSVFSVTGTWFHIGITHKIDTTSGFITVYINGVEVLAYTGDTRPSQWDVTPSPDELIFVNDAALVHIAGRFHSSDLGFDDVYVDDVYIDSIVGEADAPVPSRRFLMVLPTGTGEDADWTPVPVVANYLNVDENPNDGETTYNKAIAADLRDTFAMGNITLPVDHRIVAVLPSPFARRLDSAFASEISVHAWDGLQYEDSADLELSMAFDVPVFARFELQPDGSAWNETDFNAMQFGYRSRGVF